MPTSSSNPTLSASRTQSIVASLSTSGAAGNEECKPVLTSRADDAIQSHFKPAGVRLMLSTLVRLELFSSESGSRCIGSASNDDEARKSTWTVLHMGKDLPQRSALCSAIFMLGLFLGLHQGFGFRTSFFIFSSVDSQRGVEAQASSGSLQPQIQRIKWRKGAAMPPRTGHIAIVVPDTRDITRINSSYPQWTTLLNLRYAASHDYDLLFYHIVRKGKEIVDPLTACHHPLEGPRIDTWCKLVPVIHALRQGYDWVIFLDTDAYFHVDDSLFDLLQHYADNEAIMNHSVFFTGDADSNPNLPNTGIFFVKKTPKAEKFMLRWWNTKSGEYRQKALAEQQLLWTSILPKADDNETFYLMDNWQAVTRWETPIQHVTHYAPDLRATWIPQWLASQDITEVFKKNGSSLAAWTDRRKLLKHFRLIDFDPTAYIRHESKYLKDRRRR